MEGHKWAGSSPLFLPWANTERFDHLRRTLGAGASLSLREVLTSTPEGLLPYVDGRVLHFYSQAWALVHFLREGEGGRYRTALQSLLLDAQAGRIRQVVGLRLRELNIRPEDAGSWGEIVFRAYFEADLDDADARYQRFLRDITSTGARDRIVAGQSPLNATP